jgi:hypothetical protein
MENRICCLFSERTQDCRVTEIAATWPYTLLLAFCLFLVSLFLWDGGVSIPRTEQAKSSGAFQKQW